MRDRYVVTGLIRGWAVLALLLALFGVRDAAPAAVPLVVVAAFAGGAAAWLAAAAWRADRRYLAGMLMIASALTPTNGAVVLNSAALIVGFAIAVRGLRPRRVALR